MKRLRRLIVVTAVSPGRRLRGGAPDKILSARDSIAYARRGRCLDSAFRFRWQISILLRSCVTAGFCIRSAPMKSARTNTIDGWRRRIASFRIHSSACSAPPGNSSRWTHRATASGRTTLFKARSTNSPKWISLRSSREFLSRSNSTRQRQAEQFGREFIRTKTPSTERRFQTSFTRWTRTSAADFRRL